jgi:membrane associated rhomboid family serine protease
VRRRRRPAAYLRGSRLGGGDNRPTYNQSVSSGGGPDLFIVCKNCGSEVSPYITECPYCGNRLRKRAPNLDGKGGISERPRAKRVAPSLGRIKRGEIPGIRPDSRPYVTIAAVLLSALGALIWRTGLVDFWQIAPFVGLSPFHWWQVASGAFVYLDVGYAIVCMAAIAIYGTLLEHRHGPVPVLLIVAIGGIGGIALAHEASATAVTIGGNGAALALLVAWAMQDLLALRAKVEIEGDLLLTAVIAVAVALMPLATGEASWIADAVGVLAGGVVGGLLARIRPT